MDAIEKILIRLFLIMAVGRASAQTVANYSQVNVPDVALAYVTGINNNNQLLGWTWPSAQAQRLSIVRSPDGMTWTTIHIPGIFDGVVYANGINNLGQIVGNYPDMSGGHGYIRSADGQTITIFDQPFTTQAGAKLSTNPAAINDRGEIVGSNGGGMGFLRSADGATYTTIEVPGAYTTTPTGINNEGQIVGRYMGKSAVPHGFLRSADGKYTTFDVPGSALGTSPTGINNGGVIVGNFGSILTRSHGFVRNVDGTFATFDAPGGYPTYFNAINDNGWVGGYTGYDQIVIHSFIAVLGPGSALPTIRSSVGVIAPVGFGASESITPGSWIEIYGQNLAGSTRQWGTADFSGTTAPTSLDGVSVSINGQAAFVAYVSPVQVNVLVPSAVLPGTAQVTVSVSGHTSPPYSVPVIATQPSVLYLADPNYSSISYALATFADNVTYALPPGEFPGGSSRAAKPGETITFYGVGFGDVTPSIPAGQVTTQLNSLKASLQVLIGGIPATVSYAGLMPGAAGLYQINAVVPAGIPTPPVSGVSVSDLAPVSIVLNGTTMPIRLYAAFSQ